MYSSECTYFYISKNVTSYTFLLVFNVVQKLHCILKDTHGERTSSNKTEALMKSMNMYIWVSGIVNQVFIRGSYTPIRFSKKEVVSGKIRSFL